MHAFLSRFKVYRSAASSLTISSMLPVELTIQAHVHGSKATISRFFSFTLFWMFNFPIVACLTK